MSSSHSERMSIPKRSTSGMLRSTDKGASSRSHACPPRNGATLPPDWSHDPLMAELVISAVPAPEKQEHRVQVSPEFSAPKVSTNRSVKLNKLWRVLLRCSQRLWLPSHGDEGALGPSRRL